MKTCPNCGILYKDDCSYCVFCMKFGLDVKLRDLKQNDRSVS